MLLALFLLRACAFDRPPHTHFLAVGATVADNLQTLANDDRLVMLRDPWGFAIQLVARATRSSLQAKLLSPFSSL